MTEQTTASERPSSRATPSFDLVQTGIPGLDTVLNGGIPAGTLLLISGAPGAGKTVLTQQICFSIAARGAGRAVYFSTLSEPHNKLLRQLESFSFFDRDYLGDVVLLFALQEFLKQGLDATAEVIVQTVRQQRAQLVCIDGYRAIEALCKSEAEARQFLYQLSAQLSLLGATLLITLERDSMQEDDYGAYTIADGVLACYHVLNGVQRRRKVEVKKLRSMAHLHGLHSYRISSDGWTVFPRIEALVPTELSSAPPAAHGERQLFDIPEFDRLLGGGVPAGSATLIAGEPGIGKTLLGLHFFRAGLRRGEPSLFLGFNERRDQLINKMEQFGLPIGEFVRSGLASIRTFAPVEVEPDEVSVAIYQEVAARGIRRVVIDETFELERATAREERSYDYLGALATYLRSAGVTVCMTKTMPKVGVEEIDLSATPLSVVAENLLLLRHIGFNTARRYALAILKMRDSAYDSYLYEYAIGAQGLQILGRFPRSAGVESALDNANENSDSTA